MSTTLDARRSNSERLLTDRLYHSSSSALQRRQVSFSSASMEVSPRLVLRFGADRIILEPVPGDWLLPMLEKICELGTLPPNWNSYRSKAISTDAAVASISILLNLLRPSDPPPSIVPTSRGGILLEWHENGIDLEVDVRSSSQVHLAYNDGDVEEEIDRASLEAIGETLQMLRLSIK